jgi:hypothetical protein
MRQSRKWLALGLVPLLPMMGFILALRTNPGFRTALMGVPNLPAYIATTVVLIMAWGFYTAFKWWQAADEAVKEAHKVAWFWGGLIGVSAVVLPLVLSVLPTHGQSYETFKAIFNVHPGIGEFLAGIITTLVAMFVGYAIAWALWWRKHA